MTPTPEWLQEKLFRSVEDIADDMRRGRYLDACEALDCGLIDAIGP
jgi:ATP-dependent protease ClpP protease subunit